MNAHAINHFSGLTYDAENRLIQVDGTVGNCSTATACYLYDAEGRRVEKNASGGYKDYLYDLAGHVAGEWLVFPGFTGAGAHYAYFAGQLVAEYENSTTYFVHQDHLGSVHLITGVDQSIKQCNNFLPFGESDTDGCSVTSDQAGQTHKFTGDERDTETGQDHTEFRQYDSSLGRWMTPGNAGSDCPPSSSTCGLPLNTLLTDSNGNLSFLTSPDDYTAFVNASLSDNPSIQTEDAPLGSVLEQECNGCLLSQMQNDPQSMAALNVAASALDNPWTYAEFFGFSILGGAAASAAEGYAALVELGQYAEAVVPGAMDVTIDIMNVVGPIPSIGATLPGLIYNGYSIGSSLWDACFGGGNCIQTGWDWFNGDEVNAPYKP